MIILAFLILFVVCEAKHFSRSMFIEQTRNIYLASLIITILLYTKVWFIVYDLLIIEEFLVILTKAVKLINNEIENSERINSRVYNRMIQKKYVIIVRMYKLVQRMVNIFNDMGITQLATLLAIKSYLMGDFYWISLVTMHNRIPMRVTYSKLKCN